MIQVRVRQKQMRDGCRVDTYLLEFTSEIVIVYVPRVNTQGALPIRIEEQIDVLVLDSIQSVGYLSRFLGVKQIAAHLRPETSPYPDEIKSQMLLQRR